MQRENCPRIKAGQNQTHKEKEAMNKGSQPLNWSYEAGAQPGTGECHYREVAFFF